MRRSSIDIPIKDRYCLTVNEASAYFSIGQNKLREIIASNRGADYLLWIGNTVRIKRVEFESYLANLRYI